MAQDEPPPFMPGRAAPPAPGLLGTVLRAAFVMALINLGLFMLLAVQPEPPRADPAGPVSPPPAAGVAAAEPERLQEQPVPVAREDQGPATLPVSVKPLPDAAADGASSPAIAPAALKLPEAAGAPAPQTTLPVAPGGAARGEKLQKNSQMPLPARKPARVARAKPAHEPAMPLVTTSAPADETAPKPPAPTEARCRPYAANSSLAGEQRRVQGIACAEPSGGWRIITEAGAHQR